MQKAYGLVVASTQFNGFVILVVGDVLSTVRYIGIDKVYVCVHRVSVRAFDPKISG